MNDNATFSKPPEQKLIENRYFYHSFRRVRPEEDQAVALDQALAILGIIKKIGLVLAPEVITWEIPLTDGSLKRIQHRQTRVCFTELSRAELPDHAKKFGPISLEFPLDTLRKSAALPVIYIPQMVTGDRLLSSAGPVMVWMFQMIQYTLDQLENLRVLSDPISALEFAQKNNPTATYVDEYYTLRLQNKEGDGPVERELCVPAKTVRGILDFIGYKTAPFALMRGAAYAAQTLFYPTDDQIHDNLLAYYRQREWRLIPGFASQGAENTRRLSDAEKNLLISIDQRFWTRELSDDEGVFRRIDEAQIIESFQGKTIENVIRAVLVPQAAYDRVAPIFGDLVQVLE